MSAVIVPRRPVTAKLPGVASGSLAARYPTAAADIAPTRSTAPKPRCVGVPRPPSIHDHIRPGTLGRASDARLAHDGSTRPGATESARASIKISPGLSPCVSYVL